MERFKIMYGFKSVDRNAFFTKGTYSNLSDNEDTIPVKLYRFNIRKYFTDRVVGMWNSLFLHCMVLSTDVINFKKIYEVWFGFFV